MKPMTDLQRRVLRILADSPNHDFSCGELLGRRKAMTASNTLRALSTRGFVTSHWGKGRKGYTCCYWRITQDGLEASKLPSTSSTTS